eukprot:NODE_532_length_6386_cov_0.597264.p5 type:complete len:154 gc:universal NODE_532_length_6386_cov_0.597264:4115-4576(+)
MNSTGLSSSCQTAYTSVTDCVSNSNDTKASLICDQCGDLTETLFPQCSEADFKNITVLVPAMRCHQEDDTICYPDPSKKLNPKTCESKCDQFNSKMLLLSGGDELKKLNDKELQSVKGCAAKYPNDTQIGTGSTSSAMTATFSVLSVSILLLV